MSTAPHEDHEQSADAEYTSMPTWVRWFLVAAAVVVIGVIIVLLSGGQHGPGRHLSSEGPARSMTASALR